MKLLAAVIFLGKNRMEAAVIDSKGSIRRLGFDWKKREPTNVPPENMMSLLEAEVNFRQEEELKVAKGRKLPRR